MYNRKQFEEIVQKAEKNNIKEYAKSILSLMEKLDEKSIEDSELNTKFNELAEALNKRLEGEKVSRVLSKTFAQIVDRAEKQHKLHQKGSLQGRYLALFMGVGVAIGAGMMSINSGMMGVGIAIGAGLGVAIGSSKEKQAEQEGRLY